MNTSYLFRKMLGIALATLLLLGVFSLPVFAEPALQDDESSPAHLIIGVDGEWSSMGVNRSSWDDFSATNPLHPGMALQERDYVGISGNTTLFVLCSDLKIVEMFADGVADCAKTDTSAFINMDAPFWSFDGVAVLVPSDAIVMPDDIEELNPVLADSDVVAQANGIIETISGLGLDEGTTAYVAAYALASHGFYLDAVNIILAAEDLQCNAQRDFVEVDEGETVYEYPSVYLRMGEWYAILGNPDVSQRYLQCAVDLAESSEDALSAGLAYSRLAVVTDDAAERTASYQSAIENFVTLSAEDAVETLLDACGSANCTAP